MNKLKTCFECKEKYPSNSGVRVYRGNSEVPKLYCSDDCLINYR